MLVIEELKILCLKLCVACINEVLSIMLTEESNKTEKNLHKY